MKATQYSGYMEKDRQEAKEKSKREVFFGDSWFTSRRLCVAAKEELGHEYFGAMKTNHSGTPKEDVEKIMKDWPSGSYLVVECDELQLFMVGYKYSYKKKASFCILRFILSWTKGGLTLSCLFFSVLLPWHMEFWDYNTRGTIHCQMA